MIYGITAGMIVIFASVFGSCLGLVFKKISHRTNDMFLGFAAGVMLAAAFMGLLPTAFSGEGIFSIILGISGILIGSIFISMIDRFTPHAHLDNGAILPSQTTSHISKTLLLVIAIAIHNIPEGLATGIVFGKGVTQNAIMMTISMAIQKVPEGLIVAIPLLGMGFSRKKVFLYSCGVALMMLPGVIIGASLGSLPALLEVFFYAFTFGAIVYVVSNEIIPESHKHGFERPVTFSLIGGVIIVALLQFI